ncbi:hypothetical protein DID78_01470 [Candidatus Marinamargulisbacteria bacterium SCGC AG-343-D04]|nr:hypothetical protein DID78_01470 [Candidatus Marinamargulisbacteria bacterium SCGC AG-343-D04]
MNTTTSTFTASAKTLPVSGGELSLFNEEVSQIIPGFRLNQREFGSDYISIDLSNTELSSKKLSEFLDLCNKYGIDKKIKSLDLSFLQLTELPKSIEQLTSLTELHISCNKLTALPKSIENLSALTALRISDNQLTSLPKWIGNLTALTTLVLCNNKLTDLPKSIRNLMKLEIIALHNNPGDLNQALPWWLKSTELAIEKVENPHPDLVRVGTDSLTIGSTTLRAGEQQERTTLLSQMKENVREWPNVIIPKFLAPNSPVFGPCLGSIVSASCLLKFGSREMVTQQVTKLAIRAILRSAERIKNLELARLDQTGDEVRSTSKQNEGESTELDEQIPSLSLEVWREILKTWITRQFSRTQTP